MDKIYLYKKPAAHEDKKLRSYSFISSIIEWRTDYDF